MKSGCAREWGGWGRISDDGPGQQNPDRSEGPWGRAAESARTEVFRSASSLTQCRESRWQQRARRAMANQFAGKAPSESPALKPYRGKPAVRKRVQRKLVCSVGGRPTEVTVRSLVAWIAECRETESRKPIDKAILRMVSESSGRNESERRNGLETEAPEAEPSFMRRRQHGSSQTD